MRRTLMTVLTLGILFVPATLDAQQPGPRRGHAPPELRGNAAARVLALPTVLELTERQVAQLQQIRDRANAENQPLLAQLQAARPPRAPRDRGAQRDSAQVQPRRAELQAKRQQLQPVVAQLRENAQKTRREVESVLTSEQLSKLRELESARRSVGERGQRPAR